MKKILISLFAFCAFAQFLFAEQIFIYKTFEDYNNNTPSVMEGEIKTFSGYRTLTYDSGFTVRFEKEKKMF